MTPLKGVDGEVYALAQGSLLVGGLDAEGGDGSRITVNVPSVGRIPNGAIVEREIGTGFEAGNSLVLNLHTSDFTTAYRMAEVINETIGPGTAQALDATSVQVYAPQNPSQRVSYLAMLENLTVQPGEAAAKVIVNSRTGTVVIGSGVRVMPAAVSHGSMTVTITQDPLISQPAPMAAGQTAVVPRADIEVEQAESRMFMFNPGVELEEIVRAVNQVGAAPSDLMAILEALKEAGALRAELIII